MKWPLTLLAYLTVLVPVALVAFFLVLFLAGPRAGLLPKRAETAVLASGWLGTLALPVPAARMVWRRFGKARVP